MANALIAWDNAAVDSLQIFNDGYGTYDPSIENLKQQSLALKWVTPGLAANFTRFTCGFATVAGQPTIKLIALCSHNLSLAATVRIRASTVSNFASLAYDSGTLNAYPGAVTEADRRGMRWNYWHLLSTPTAAAYWRIDISDASNSAGFVSVGRLLACTGAWQPSVNMLAGAALGWESNAEVQKALNGAEWFTEAEGARVARFKLHPMPRAEVLVNAFDLNRAAAGNKREALFVYDPADTQHLVRRSFMGRLRNLSPLEEPQPLALQGAYEIKELL